MHAVMMQQFVLTKYAQIYSDDEKTQMTATYVVGRVRRFHARKDLFGPTNAIEPQRLLPISRMGGITYGRVTDVFGEHEQIAIRMYS